MKELTLEETKEVSGGIWQWALGYVASKGVDAYIDWAKNGADGWTVEYNGEGYNDPLL